MLEICIYFYAIYELRQNAMILTFPTAGMAPKKSLNKMEPCLISKKKPATIYCGFHTPKSSNSTLLSNPGSGVNHIG